MPGSFQDMVPCPDHGESSWKGTGWLKDKIPLISDGDSGIRRAIAIAMLARAPT